MSVVPQMKALEEVENKLSELKKQKRQLKRQISEGRNVSDYNLLVLKSLVVQSAGDVTAALKFIVHKDPARFGQRTQSEWQAHLKEYWLNATDAEKQRVSSGPVKAIEKNATSSAAKFLREYSLFEWLKEQNEDHQIAPSSEALLTKAGEETNCPVGPIIQKTQNSKNAYQTMRRYRRRWSVANVSIKPKEALSSSVIQRKVVEENISCCPCRNPVTKKTTCPITKSMLPLTLLEILHIQTHGHVIAVLTTWKTTGVFSQQAKALWRLSNFQHSRLNKTKTAVRINLDETSVCLTQCEKRGWLLPEVRKRMWRGESVTGEVKTKAMKTNFSHVCMICDNPDINKALPQVLIFKEDLMSGELLQALKDVAPKHWVLLRQPKAWCNNDAMKKVLAKLEAILVDYRSTHEFILMFDTFRSHICAPTLKSLGNMGLSTVIIPAKTTSLLQPLDVYGFAQYKRSLRLKSMLRRLRFPREVNTWRRMVDILVSTTTEVLVKKIGLLLFNVWGYQVTRPR